MPVNNGVWKDTVIPVNFTVYAPDQLVSATASVGTRQASLTPTNGNIFSGKLSLSGLAGDTLTLLITAKDAQNNTGDTAVTFIYRPLNDPGVPLTVDSTVDSIAVKSVFPLEARCPGSTIAVYYASTYEDVLIATAQDSIPALDLVAFNGKRLALKVVATDNLGRTATKQLTAFIESSPYLTEYLTVNGNMRDFRYNKALVALKGSNLPVLVDGTSGQQSAPLLDTPAVGAYVTAEGAMISTYRKVYEWRNGQITFQTEGAALSVSGNYACWLKGIYEIVRRQRQTGAMDSFSVQSTGAYPGGAVIAENGLIAFTVGMTRQSSVYKYDSGQVKRISTNTENTSLLPLTDGHNIIYQAGDYNPSIYFFNGKTQLISWLAGSAGYADYQVNNGYTAFVREGQVQLRDTLGVFHQVSNFNTCPACANGGVIDLLNSKGELMMASLDSGRYFVDAGHQRRRITTMPARTGPYDILSRSFYDNGNWYILIGRTLFKVNLDTVAVNHITDLGKTMKPDSALSFTRQDFASHFSGAGELVNVKIATLPKHGALKLQSQALNASQPVAASLLDQLSYTPNSGYTGIDTIRWIASNGLNYTADTALILISITDSSTIAVPQPVVSGLFSNYCGGAGNQQVKIVNLPTAASGIQVTVTLDSTTILPVAADSTFSIHPDALSAGTHTIDVVFTQDTVKKRLSLSFKVTPAVTPALDVSVNVNPITTDTIPVVITATNVTGGGKQPLYTFAWDPQFSNQLQIEGTQNSVTLSAAAFELGANWVYARVRTSEQCYTSQTGIDSIKINKTNITAIVDADDPSQPVITYPNPFHEQISVNGLQSMKAYIISLYDIQGKLL
ncbi:MAG TPA: hypothetical protein VGD35_24410, partial [Chitinophaga sp.]